MNISISALRASFDSKGGHLQRDTPSLVEAVNYLHHGRALDLWNEFLARQDSAEGVDDRLNSLSHQVSGGRELVKLIDSYRRNQGDLSFDALKQAFAGSLDWRERFRMLGCRGFSYSVNLGMRGYNGMRRSACQLSSQVDLRIALMPRLELFYPPRVRRYLRRTPWAASHYFQGKIPAIAFCFGRKLPEAWYVLVLQSDLASKGPTCVREHFRGWRNVLFASVVAQGIGKVRKIYLCRAADVERACLSGTKNAGYIPQTWMSIYDRTAEEWGMKVATVDQPVDVQIYRRKRPVYSHEFYELSL